MRQGTALALTTVAVSMLAAGWAVAIGSLVLLALFAVTLDSATQVNQVLGQRVIYALPGEERGRLNAVYMASMFALGAGGGALATLTYQAGGWTATAAAGLALSLLALAAFATEFLPGRRVTTG